jgi:hypothetical protein
MQQKLNAARELAVLHVTFGRQVRRNALFCDREHKRTPCDY